MPTAGSADALGHVIQAYVNNHPADEVVPVSQGRDLGWPYCNPDPDLNTAAGSDADVPFVADALTNPGGTAFDCASLSPIEVGLAAHSAPLGLAFLEVAGSQPRGRGRGGGRSPRLVGSPTAPTSAVLWMPWDIVAGDAPDRR